MQAHNHLHSTLQEAFGAHRAGKLDDAEKLYKMVLAADKNQFEAVHFLGLLEFQRGRHEQASASTEAGLIVNARDG